MSDGSVFLSYRSTEKDFTRRLAIDLGRNGYSVWMDRLQGIRSGDDWVQTLQDALNQASVLIAILSPAYATSEDCRKELKRALSLRIPVQLVLLHELLPQQWPLEIQTIQYVDFRGWDEPARYTARLQELIEDGLQATRGVVRRTAEAVALEPVEGLPLPGRDLEDDVAQALAAESRSAPASAFARMQMSAYAKELKTLTAQWQAAFEQRL